MDVLAVGRVLVCDSRKSWLWPGAWPSLSGGYINILKVYKPQFHRFLTVVIGFKWRVERDHTVGVIVDGEFIFASEEERWTRYKHLPSEPPINATRPSSP